MSNDKAKASDSLRASTSPTNENDNNDNNNCDENYNADID